MKDLATMILSVTATDTRYTVNASVAAMTLANDDSEAALA
jgi:hypothetical protein